MLVAVADTHALLWYMYDDDRLSTRVSELINDAESAGNRIGFSVMSLIEVTYLQEKNRIPQRTLTHIESTISDPNTVLLELPIDRLIAMSVEQVDRVQVPELPDRVIAATAMVYRVPLLSRDGMITASDIHTIW